ncbi:MAG: hypothetical protein ACXVAE_06765 [Candidatus Limnocylindrales bacterium]|jgi:Zn finger protein HypA/HybF involved in hydrogenase expression
MHEAAIVQAALADALRFAPAQRGRAQPRALEVLVTDPVDVGADSVALHLEVAMHDLGFSGVPIEMTVRPIECQACGAQNRPEPAWAFCDVCGWPLPLQAGPGVRIHARW